MLLLIGLRAAFAAFGDVGSFLKILPASVVKFIGTPDGTLFLLLFGFGLLWWAVRHPKAASDDDSLHQANTRHENKLAALEGQLATKLSARRLTEPQKSTLRARLGPLNEQWMADGRQGVRLVVYWTGAGDNAEYAKQFEEFFRSLKFDVPAHHGGFGTWTEFEHDYDRGVCVRWNSEREIAQGAPPIGKALVEALKEIGVEDVTPFDHRDSPPLELIIGARRRLD